MKTVLAVLLTVTLVAPACLCPLHAAPAEEPSHSCCTESRSPSQPDTAPEGCATGCGHCAQEMQSPQDLPKAAPALFPQTPEAVVFALSTSTIRLSGPVRAAALPPSSPPPGHLRLHLLHCSLLC